MQIHNKNIRNIAQSLLSQYDVERQTNNLEFRRGLFFFQNAYLVALAKVQRVKRLEECVCRDDASLSNGCFQLPRASSIDLVTHNSGRAPTTKIDVRVSRHRLRFYIRPETTRRDIKPTVSPEKGAGLKYILMKSVDKCES